MRRGKTATAVTMTMCLAFVSQVNIDADVSAAFGLKPLGIGVVAAMIAYVCASW